jgi:hypothetical protein
VLDVSDGALRPSSHALNTHSGFYARLVFARFGHRTGETGLVDGPVVILVVAHLTTLRPVSQGSLVSRDHFSRALDTTLGALLPQPGKTVIEGLRAMSEQAA